MTNQLLITSKTDWSEDLIRQVYDEIETIAREELLLNVYQNQIEIISADQMIDAYSSVGLPVMYNHWSFGKSFIKDWKAYQSGSKGLAYEIVINSDPCISYLMEENDMVMQTLVIAHAAFGHNAVFKNNYMFKTWTNAGSIIDYMMFAKRFISQCEERYGVDVVEEVLDMAHMLSNNGVDHSKRKHKKKMSSEDAVTEMMRMEEEELKDFDLILKRTSLRRDETRDVQEEAEDDLNMSEENLLYFIYKRSPNLPQWKKEILRIVHKVNQYFLPQSNTKVLNEGFATFTHYYIMNRLEEKGIISPDAHMSWLASHSGVIFQTEYNSKYGFNGWNPYALGFAIFKDIKRICENPTEEDKEWFPALIGKDWREAIQDAAFEYRDESFIQQFLSPKVIRDFRMFTARYDNQGGVIKDISDSIGYAEIRKDLAESFARINFVPEIIIKGAEFSGDRTLHLKYNRFNDRDLDENTAARVIAAIIKLWGYEVEFEGIDWFPEDKVKMPPIQFYP